MNKADFYEWIIKHSGKTVIENPITQKPVGVWAHIRETDIPADTRIFSPVQAEIWNSTYSAADGLCLIRLFPPQAWMKDAPTYD